MSGPIGFLDAGIVHDNADVACERVEADVPQIPMPEWSPFYGEQLARMGIDTTGGAL